MSTCSGPDVLVAPVTTHGARERQVYLPHGASWLDAWTGEPVEGKGWTTAVGALGAHTLSTCAAGEP